MNAFLFAVENQQLNVASFLLDARADLIHSKRHVSCLSVCLSVCLDIAFSIIEVLSLPHFLISLLYKINLSETIELVFRTAALRYN